MKLNQIRSLVVLATELHYRRAAIRLGISQSALSQQIRNLERDLGVLLLDRNRRSVRLTAAGRRMVRDAVPILEQLDDLTVAVRRIHAGISGELTVAVTRSASTGLSTQIVELTRARHPGVTVTVGSGFTRVNLERLRSREIDIGFVRPPVDLGDDLEILELGEEPIVLALPVDHPLAQSSRIERGAIRDLPLIYFPRRDGPGHYERLLNECYGSHRPRIVRIEPEEESMLVAVSHGHGVGLLTMRRAETLRIPGVVIRHFRSPEPTAGLAVCWHREGKAPVLHHFLEAAAEISSGTVPPGSTGVVAA